MTDQIAARPYSVNYTVLLFFIFCLLRYSLSFLWKCHGGPSPCKSPFALDDSESLHIDRTNC
ncbi:hypothetical protein C0Q70_05692 [Pomacea canaliculata]|uniref:Uncharacterized protein n=1 Tax=Pomacea canaliculata TaxID=400727 RepID=A0A2T7PLX2_POMCA|nr:hypothetical protein C0Q70_05692 [Pomacea canaliculata]